MQAIRTGAKEIILTEADLPPARVSGNWPPPAYALFTRLGFSEGKVVFTEPDLVSAPGTAYFARATGISPTIRKLTEEFILEQTKELADIDVAQLTYFLPGKSAAFVQYPALAPFELVLAARGSLDESRRLDVNDLIVSSSGDTVILRSHKTGRRVVLMTTGAANPNRDVLTSLARFLLSMRQGGFSGGFNWGAPYDAAPFLPRIKFERHTLALARWRLSKADTHDLRTKKTVQERWDAVQSLRTRLELPRFVAFSEHSDHLLPVDLDDVLSVEAWLAIAAEEMLLTEREESSAVLSPDGPFRNEAVFPVLVPRAKAAKALALGGNAYQAYEPKEAFDTLLPGGTCLYLKVYGGRGDLIRTLTDTLASLLSTALSAGEISNWFFLPFSDPDAHLRIRAFGSADQLFAGLLPRINDALAPLLATRVIRKVDVCSYERETYRYGGPRTMDICERVFCGSSMAALHFHDTFEGDLSSPRDLAKDQVRSIRGFLALAGLTVEEQRKQLSKTGDMYTRTSDRMIPKRVSGELLRKDRASLLEPVDPIAMWGEDICNVIADSLSELKKECMEGRCKRAYEDLLADILHVHSIRLLTTWCEVPNLEAVGYFLTEKVIAAEQAMDRARQSSD